MIMKNLLKILNENHWYIAAIFILAGIGFWTHGCESKVGSVIDPSKKINRAELQVELAYLVGQVEVKVADLDRQDAIKQALFDAMVIVGQGGQINTMGLVNLAATIGAISFGLNRNQKYKNARSANSTA